MSRETWSVFGIPVFSRTQKLDVETVPKAAPGSGRVRQDRLPDVANMPPQAVRSSLPAALAGLDGYVSMFGMSFNGEKNLGELGPIIQYEVDHAALRARSWQLYLESEICQIVFKRFARWVIGSGLKLQSEPKAAVLASEKITIEFENFSNTVEEIFHVFAASKLADYSGMRNLHRLARRAFINAIVGGDVLVILRVETSSTVSVQLIDAAHVGTPLGYRIDGKDFRGETGNRIRHGVEIDDRGRHVAYHVRKSGALAEYERIPARGENSDTLIAFMLYGLEYRIDSVRGMPLITAVMETAKKMERFKEATLASAEERAKLAMFVEHGPSSTGENPMASMLAAFNGFDGDAPAASAADNGDLFARNVAISTNKQVFNMPPDTTMKSLESKNEAGFRDFYTINIDIVCATVDIPPNVAMGKYDSNFSASRAALKDWEHTLLVERKDFADEFYQNVYNLWLDVQVLSNKVAAPGYLKARAKGNLMALCAYRFARWVGANVPHIDPLKEVMAERAKLGGLAANAPLSTIEASTEALNGGDSRANVAQFAKELEKGQELGVDFAAKTPGNSSPDKQDQNDE